jgi:hypothetical protein
VGGDVSGDGVGAHPRANGERRGERRQQCNFTIAAPFVTVTSPKSGVVWTIGSTNAITWRHNLGTAGAVKIEISRNGGTTWSVMSSSSQNSGASAGSYSWAVSGPATTTGRLRVTWTSNTAVADRNNGSFTIQ